MMALALSAVLLVSCAACSKGDEGSGDKTDSKAGFSKDSLCIVYEGTKYQVNVKADKVKAALYSLGLDGFTQDLSSADEDYIPEWDF